MLYCIRFTDTIKRMMISHTFEDPFKECGGFLYGDYHVENDSVFYDVDAIYYEDIKGTDCSFNFNLGYIVRGLSTANNNGFNDLIGTYHSHGQYPAFLSEIDYNNLQQYFGSNKITVVYSPKYSRIVGEVLDNDGISHRAKILTMH